MQTDHHLQHIRHTGTLPELQGLPGARTSWRFDDPGGVPSDEQRSCAALIPPVSPKTNCHPPRRPLSHFSEQAVGVGERRQEYPGRQ